jgi:mannose-6-phosphate isomerase-like protein (cupin superfamily)
VRLLSEAGVQSQINKFDPAAEFFTPERCWIVETWSNASMSIARARVEPGVTTAWHALEGVDEQYIIVAGRGRMELGDMAPTLVGPSDTVRIPAGVAQRITNVGQTGLIFFCVCTPRFRPECYRDLESTPDA